MKPLFFINCCQKYENAGNVRAADATKNHRAADATKNHDAVLCGGGVVKIFKDYCVEKDAISTPQNATTKAMESLHIFEPPPPAKYAFDGSDLRITSTVYFTFLSESVRGNRIIIRVYDENQDEIPEIYCYQFEKTDRPERIDIPLSVPKNSTRKYTYHYRVCNTRLSEVYYSGKFVIVAPKCRAHLTIGFACMSARQTNNIFSYKEKKNDFSNIENETRISQYDAVWHRMSSWRDSFNFDLICHGGNNSLVASLFDLYTKRSSVSDLFACFRSQVCTFLADEAVSHVLRQNWNLFFFNELDLNIWYNPSRTARNMRHISDSQGEYSAASEFMYYLRIMYENYFMCVSRAHGICFHSRLSVSSCNILTLDAWSTRILDGTFFDEKHRLFLSRSLCRDKLNIVLINTPLRYYGRREQSAELLLKHMMVLAASYNIKIVSFHKDGDSYIQVHKQGDLTIEECVCSGFNFENPCDSLFKRLCLGTVLFCRKKRDRLAARRNRAHIITTGFKSMHSARGCAILVNNFLMCLAIR
jgi:hypothetical protein